MAASLASCSWGLGYGSLTAEHHTPLFQAQSSKQDTLAARLARDMMEAYLDAVAREIWRKVAA